MLCNTSLLTFRDALCDGLVRKQPPLQAANLFFLFSSSAVEAAENMAFKLALKEG